MNKQDARIQHLEEALAHTTRLAEELSDVVAQLRAEQERMLRRLDMLMLREAEREADAGGTIPLADQRPPHW